MVFSTSYGSKDVFKGHQRKSESEVDSVTLRVTVITAVDKRYGRDKRL